jgi:ABC-2 type transport system permease protein
MSERLILDDALRFEWVRIRTLRSTYWLIASALLVSVAAAFLIAFVERDDRHTHEIVGAVLTGGGPVAPVPFVGVFLAVVGILATGHEYRYGTIQPTLTAVPQRSTLLTAKIVVLLATALVVTAVSLIAATAATLLVWGGVPGLADGPVSAVIVGYFVLTLLWTVLGAAIAQLFRGVPAALVVILVVPLIVEQLILNLSNVPALHWLKPAVKFLPFTAGQQLLSSSGKGNGEFFDRWASGGVFAAFAAIILAVAWTLFTRRDA